MFNVKTALKYFFSMKPIFHFSMYNVKSKLQNLSLTLQRGTFFRTLAQRRKYNLNMSSLFSEKMNALSVYLQGMLERQC